MRVRPAAVLTAFVRHLERSQRSAGSSRTSKEHSKGDAMSMHKRTMVSAVVVVTDPTVPLVAAAPDAEAAVVSRPDAPE